MRWRLVVLVLALFLGSRAVPVCAFTEVSGPVTGDTTWTGPDTVLVTGGVSVAPGARLTIEPQTVILFDLYSTLEVEGELWACGDSANPILLTSTTDTAGSTPVAGSWNGVALLAGGAGVLRHCHIRLASNGIWSFLATIEVQDCVVEDFLGRGMWIDGSTSEPPLVAVIDHCTVRQVDPSLQGLARGIVVFRSVNASISHCEVSHCAYGIEFYSLTTGRPHFVVESCEVRDHAMFGIYSHTGG